MADVAPPSPAATPLARPSAVPPTRNKPSAPPARPTTSATSEARGAASPPAPTVQGAAVSVAESWEQLFNDWPEGVPQRGVVVNQLNEQIPFKAYMVRGNSVLLERTNPDTLGARFLFVPYSEISLVKLTDPIKQELFEKAGFVGKLAN